MSVSGNGRCRAVDVKQKRIKGSYTVEMACISGVWLLVIFASLLLILGSYGKVWDTAISCETAVYGSTAAVSRIADGVGAAKEKAAAHGENYIVSGSKREITVTFEDHLKIPFVNLAWRRTGVLKSKVVRPVLFIEKVQKSRRFRENLRN